MSCIKVEYSKPPISVSAQLELLKGRGLIIGNEADALRKIEHTGYFRLSGYLKYFQDELDRFRLWTTFEQVWDLYVFDRKLRLLTLDAIEKIEISVKAEISQNMSLANGCFWYVDKSRFQLASEPSVQMFERLKDRIEKIPKKSSSVFVEKYYEKYSDRFLPSWMIFEEFTMGEAASVFALLHVGDRVRIAAAYGAYHEDLNVWLKILTHIRNISAHHARLWNRRYVYRPRTRDSSLGALYQCAYNSRGKKEALPNYYNAALIIRYLLQRIDGNFSWIDDLEILFSEHPMVKVPSMGFWPDSFAILSWVGR